MHYFYQTMVKHTDGTYTQFTALDKIIKKRTYLLYVDIFTNDINAANDPNVYFDPEWMTITKAFNDYTVFEKKPFDFSAFIRNNDLYFKHIKNTQNRTFVIKEKTFEETLITHRKFFDDLFSKKENQIWQYKNPKEYRDYIINVLAMYDSFKNKAVKKDKVINNKEELKFDLDTFDFK